jgi:hypothetical protein
MCVFPWREKSPMMTIFCVVGEIRIKAPLAPQIHSQPHRNSHQVDLTAHPDVPTFGSLLHFSHSWVVGADHEFWRKCVALRRGLCYILLYVTFYFTTNNSNKSVFSKLDMVRLLFCVLTNVLSYLSIICVLSCYNKVLYFFGGCLAIFFTFRYVIVHFKYLTGDIFCE